MTYRGRNISSGCGFILVQSQLVGKNIIDKKDFNEDFFLWLNNFLMILDAMNILLILICNDQSDSIFKLKFRSFFKSVWNIYYGLRY